jgi:hypothetical protein
MLVRRTARNVSLVRFDLAGFMVCKGDTDFCLYEGVVIGAQGHYRRSAPTCRIDGECPSGQYRIAARVGARLAPRLDT